MNSVQLIGRLTKDVEERRTPSGAAVAYITLAVDRRKKDAGADFIRCTAFNKIAELLGQYVCKGDRIGVTGHIKTGSYEKDGRSVYTTDVIIDSLDFLEPRKQGNQTEQYVNDGGLPPIGVYDDDLAF